MQSQLITTIIGPLTPDVLKALAKASRSQGALWLSSKVIQLDGQFAAMMKVDVATEAVDDLKQHLATSFPELVFAYAEPQAVTVPLTEAVTVVVDCDDRAGLTHDISHILADLDVLVEHQEYCRVQVSTLGQTVYSAKLVVRLPESISCDLLIQQLESLGGQVRVAKV